MLIIIIATAILISTPLYGSAQDKPSAPPEKDFFELYSTLLSKMSQNWKPMPITKDRIIFIKANSISKQEGGLSSVWVFISYINPQEAKVNGKTWLSMLTLDYIDCNRKAFNAKHVILFDDQLGEGNIVGEGILPDTKVHEYMHQAHPGSIGVRSIQADDWERKEETARFIRA